MPSFSVAKIVFVGHLVEVSLDNWQKQEDIERETSSVKTKFRIYILLKYL